MDEEIKNEIIDEFKKLTLIPRKSHHEEKVSSYLVNRFNELGFTTYKDDANNVIAEKRVNDTDDFIILQGHMDMVCTYNDDIDFDSYNYYLEALQGGSAG